MSVVTFTYIQLETNLICHKTRLVLTGEEGQVRVRGGGMDLRFLRNLLDEVEDKDD